MTTPDETNEVLAKCAEVAYRLTTIKVELTETELDYLLLGLGQLVGGTAAVADSLEELRVKLLSAFMKR